MNRLLFISSIVIFVIACSSKNDIPKNILSPAKMEKVLWDVVQADQFVQGYINFKHTPAAYGAISRKWYEKACSVNNVSADVFDKSLQYYYEHPELMKPVLDSISKKHPITSPTTYPGQVIDSASHLRRITDTARRRFNRKLPGDTLSAEAIP